MLTYRLARTLSSTEENQWGQLITSTLGTEVHRDRAQGFCLAREALRECFSQRGQLLSIGDIRLKNYHQVLGFDSWTLSLSHTKDWGAAVLASLNEVQSVGIDIEPIGRVVKPMIVDRISHPDDLALPPLTLWAVKEAAFKALMNTELFAHPVEFSSLLIRLFGWEHPDSGLGGEWKVSEQDGLCLALAWIKNESSARP